MNLAQTLAAHIRERPDAATLPIILLANLGSGVIGLIPDSDLRYPGFVRPRDHIGWDGSMLTRPRGFRGYPLFSRPWKA